MEYQKICISLYGNSPLPKMFVSLEKRSNDLVVRLCQVKFSKGVLFLNSCGKNACIKITKPKEEFCLKSGFNFDAEYFACFFSGEDIFMGEKGIIEDKGRLVMMFKNKFREIIQNEQAMINPDKNQACDAIIEKMFGSPSTFFFEQTKKQLTWLFSSSARLPELEQVIPCSKFIKVGRVGDEAYVGVVYRKNKVYAIGIGYSDKKVESLVSNAHYQYFYNEECQGPGYFMSFRRASDGDIVYI